MAVRTLDILRDVDQLNTLNIPSGLGGVTTVALNSVQHPIITAEVGEQRTNENDPDYSAIKRLAYIVDDGLTDDEFILINT